MKLPTLPSPLKLFEPAPASPSLGMAGATGGHMMFSSSGGGRGGNDYDDDYGFDDDYDAGPAGEPEDEEPPRRPRSTRTMRSGGATGGQTRVAQHQPEERYWTDYLRIALPVIGLLLMIGLLWFWATQLIGDSPDTTEPVNGNLGLVSEGTAAPTEQTTTQGQTTQTGSGSTIGIGNTASTPASETQQTAPTQPASTGQQQAAEPTAEPTEETAAGGEYTSGDQVVVTEDGVNVRPDASVSGDPVTMLNAGDELTIASGPVEGENYIWWEVILPSGDSGWVVEDFIEPAQ